LRRVFGLLNLININGLIPNTEQVCFIKWKNNCFLLNLPIIKEPPYYVNRWEVNTTDLASRIYFRAAARKGIRLKSGKDVK